MSHEKMRNEIVQHFSVLMHYWKIKTQFWKSKDIQWTAKFARKTNTGGLSCLVFIIILCVCMCMHVCVCLCVSICLSVCPAHPTKDLKHARQSSTNEPHAQTRACSSTPSSRFPINNHDFFHFLFSGKELCPFSKEYDIITAHVLIP